MFTRVKQSRNGEYLQIVESYRDEGRVRQRMVLYVGHYNSVADALERMPKELRLWRGRLTRLGGNEFRQKEANHIRRIVEGTDERLRALRALVEEHPELLERDRKRAARRAQRERERRASAERSDQQRELREKVGEPEVEEPTSEPDDGFYRVPPHILNSTDEALRRLRRRLRDAARGRSRRYGAVLEYADYHGYDSLTAEDWGKAEEIRVEDEHLSAEADKLTAELKRRRQ
jgi:hypothetical protein